MAQSPEEVLGLQPGAKRKLVQAKFRELATQFHPDRNHSPEAEEQFKQINEAYEQLNRGRKSRINIETTEYIVRTSSLGTNENGDEVLLVEEIHEVIPRARRLNSGHT